MRLIFELDIPNKELEYNYRVIILSFLKKSLEEYNYALKEMVYEIGNQKEMTFSPFFSVEKLDDIHKKIILKSEKMKVYISFNDFNLGFHFFNALNKMKNKKYFYKDKIFILKTVQEIEEKRIEVDRATFKLMSPMIIREGIEDYENCYHLLDENGINVWKCNLVNSLKNIFPEEELKKVEIYPLDVKKTTIDNYGNKIQGTLGTVILTGHRKILEYLYKTGLSTSKNFIGFGMAEVL